MVPKREDPQIFAQHLVRRPGQVVLGPVPFHDAPGVCYGISSRDPPTPVLHRTCIDHRRAQPVGSGQGSETCLCCSAGADQFAQVAEQAAAQPNSVATRLDKMPSLPPVAGDADRLWTFAKTCLIR